MPELKYRNGISEMPSYDVVERDWKIKINANESTLNLPPMVEDRLLGRISQLAFHRYPNEQADMLKEDIAKAYGFQKENVILGYGSSEIIEKVFHAFGGNGQKIVYPQPSFSMYSIYAKAAEAVGVPVDMEDDFSLDVAKFIDVVHKESPSLAVICNPNNPTGNVLSLVQIEEIVSSISCAFLLDEAYIEFHGASALDDVMAKYPNLMVARTFSKAYGLAGVRVGYMLGNTSIISTIEKTYMPYHMNVLTLAAADTVFQMRYEFQPRIDMTISERKRMYENLTSLPQLKTYPSATNFILFRYDKAKELNEELELAGIGVRHFENTPRLTNCLRISIGTREENDAVFSLIKSFVERNVERA